MNNRQLFSYRMIIKLKRETLTKISLIFSVLASLFIRSCFSLAFCFHVIFLRAILNFILDFIFFHWQIKYRKYLEFAKSIVAALPPGVAPVVRNISEFFLPLFPSSSVIPLFDFGEKLPENNAIIIFPQILIQI